MASRKKKTDPKKGKSNGRKPSITDSQNSIVKFVKYDDLDIVIANRKIQFREFKIKSHPYVIGVGATKLDLEHFYVVLDDYKIKMNGFIPALDLCLKMFILFGIPYPPESKAVWVMINKIFFNIKIESSLTSRIYTLFNDFEKHNDL